MSIIEETAKKGRFWRRYLEQSTYWLPKSKQWTRIDEMNESWRRNAAKWLVRHAISIELYYTIAELEMLYMPIHVAVYERPDGSAVEQLDLSAYLGPSEGLWQPTP